MDFLQSGHAHPPAVDAGVPAASSTSGLHEAPNMDSSTMSNSGRADGPHHHIRSCMSCRQRKVKCDRHRPCANCSRAKVDCVYPPGPGRAPKRPRRVLDAQLQDRLSRMEALMRRLESQGVVGGSSEVDPSNPRPQSPARRVRSSPQEVGGQSAQATADSGGSTANQAIERQFGRLLIDEKRSCYVSNVVWAALGDEIEELRDLLHGSASENETLDSAEGGQILESAVPLGSNAALMGFRALSHSLRAHHPPFQQSVTLFETFKANVAPLIRVFHMPTMIHSYGVAIASLDTLDRNMEALLFAIYYSAVISMDPEQCLYVLGVSRSDALVTYRFAVEQAIARADLLNTQSLVLLQAAVLFLSALRNEDDTRTVWSLSSLIYHIAQAMGLHRDGESFGLTPFETELRRRLWWHICLLDIRSSEGHGCEPIVRESAFDTKLPSNINDSDLTPDLVKLPAERQENTEMTFCLVRCEAIRIVWKIGYMTPDTRPPGNGTDSGSSLLERKTLAENLRQRLEGRYLKYCDASIPLFRVSENLARLIIARTWLMVHYPLTHKHNKAELDLDLQNRIFSTSVDILELCSSLFSNRDFQKWSWYLKTHIQWDSMALVLSEICSRPPSPLCDHAWEYAQSLYEQWMASSHERGGNMWRPIKRLMAKAHNIREMQKINPHCTGSNQKETDASTTGGVTDIAEKRVSSAKNLSDIPLVAVPYEEAQNREDVECNTSSTESLQLLYPYINF